MILSEQAPLKEVPIGDDSTQHEPVEKGTAMLTSKDIARHTLYSLSLSLSFSLWVDDHFIFAMEDKFYLQLYSPTAWEPIPNARLIHSQFSIPQPV